MKETSPCIGTRGTYVPNITAFHILCHGKCRSRREDMFEASYSTNNKTVMSPCTMSTTGLSENIVVPEEAYKAPFVPNFGVLENPMVAVFHWAVDIVTL